MNTLKINGQELYYRRMGQGPDVLFLHGWGVGADSYLPVLEHLARRFTVTAPDLPGFGESPEPEHVWSAEDYARCVLEFVKALRLHPIAALGHSNGGRILLELTAARQNALGLRKLVLLHAAGLKPRRTAAQKRKIALYKACKTLLRPFPGLLAKYQAGKGSADYQAASPLMRGTMNRLLGTDYTPQLPQIDLPTLLIWGKEDTAAPYADALVMEKSIPDAGLDTLEGGHWAFLEQLGVTSRVLDSFL